MMRKLSLLFAGALMGASAMSLVYGAPGSAANAAGSETYKQLAIFGDIFERVRAQYVTPPDDKSLVYTVVAVVCAIVVSIIVGAIPAMLFLRF